MGVITAPPQAYTRAIPAANMTMRGGATRFDYRHLDSPFGVEVRGMDWADLTPDTLSELTRALRRHLVLVLRGQRTPTHEESCRFFANFGPLIHQTIDGSFHYSKFPRDTDLEMHRRDDGNYLSATAEGVSELGWHNDQSHKPQFKTISVLEALEFEEGAVPTEFRDMYTAFELLPEDLRNKLDRKHAVYYDPMVPGPDEVPRLCDAVHPVFPVHPETTRRTIFGSEYSIHRIAGMTYEESAELMGRLRQFNEHNAPYFQHHWQEGDIVIWDNFGVQHKRPMGPPGKRRVLRTFEGVAEK